MKIIGFTGRKQNGKSTVCDIIKDDLEAAGMKVARINFKDPLLAMARSIGWNGIKDENGRKLLQRLGTDVVRDCVDQNYWVQAWIKAVSEQKGKVDVVLADDVRFDNEAQAVRQMGGVVIGITSPEVNHRVGNDLHTSEAGITKSFINFAFPEIAFGLTALSAVARTVTQIYLKE